MKIVCAKEFDKKAVAQSSSSMYFISKASNRDDRLIHSIPRIGETRPNIFNDQIRKLLDDLFRAGSVRQQIKHVYRAGASP